MTTSITTKKIALILAGCGHLDGAEITEAVSLNIALSKAGFTVEFYAPNRMQLDTVDHLTGNTITTNRNIIEEAARIARGNIKPLESLDLDNVEGIALAGGFGVIKNFTNFLEKGEHATLIDDIGIVLKEAISRKTPIIAICAAPMAIAIALKELGIIDATITFDNPDNAESFLPALMAWDVDHMETAINEAYCDEKYNLITSGAYMDGTATPYEILQCAEACVITFENLAEK